MDSQTPKPLYESKIRRLSRLWGGLIAVAVVFLILLILSLIKVTPFAVYSNPKFGLQIKYPEYWKIIEYPEGVEAILFMSPPEDENDRFYENINITKKPVPPDKRNFKDFSDEAVRQLTGVFEENIQILQSRTIGIAGRPGHLLIFKGRGEDSAKYMHAWFTSGATAYIITYTAREKDFDNYFKDAMDMIKSVRLL